MKAAAAVLTASNCREVSLFANYTSSKGVSMETVETPLDQPLLLKVEMERDMFVTKYSNVHTHN